MLSRLFFASYRGNKIILVFHNEKERNDFVEAEQMIRPDCHALQEKRIRNKIKGKPVTFDSSFGCLVVNA